MVIGRFTGKSLVPGINALGPATATVDPHTVRAVAVTPSHFPSGVVRLTTLANVVAFVEPKDNAPAALGVVLDGASVANVDITFIGE